MIDTDNIERAKKMIKESSDRPIIVVAQDDHFNRKIIEYGRFDILLGIERREGKESLRQIDSGFNSFLAGIARKNNISLGIDFSELRKIEKRKKAEIISRIIQNIGICKKKNVKIRLLNVKDRKDAFSFLLTLGASSKLASEAIS